MDLNPAELRIVNNALNEVLNGPEAIPEWVVAETRPKVSCGGYGRPSANPLGLAPNAGTDPP
jgi:hypothetical protein